MVEAKASISYSTDHAGTAEEGSLLAMTPEEEKKLVWKIDLQ